MFSIFICYLKIHFVSYNNTLISSLPSCNYNKISFEITHVIFWCDECVTYISVFRGFFLGGGVSTHHHCYKYFSTRKNYWFKNVPWPSFFSCCKQLVLFIIIMPSCQILNIIKFLFSSHSFIHHCLNNCFCNRPISFLYSEMTYIIFVQLFLMLLWYLNITKRWITLLGIFIWWI